jgi:hypothetical protein
MKTNLPSVASIRIWQQYTVALGTREDFGVLVHDSETWWLALTRTSRERQDLRTLSHQRTPLDPSLTEKGLKNVAREEYKRVSLRVSS